MSIMKVWTGTVWDPVSGGDAQDIILTDTVSAGVKYKLTIVTCNLSIIQVDSNLNQTLPALTDITTGKRYTLAVAAGVLKIIEL